MAERLLDLNPELDLNPVNVYLKDEKIREILNAEYDNVIDAIDTLSQKIFLNKICIEFKLRLVSSMGSGGKSDPGANPGC